MPQVKIGPKLFAKEKSMYRDWLTSIARENIQNSVDAGSTEINIRIEDDGNLKKVTFADNGPGMDLNTLETVYFVLGESTKLTNSLGTGGFGVARMLTAFAQDHYTLRTRDIYIEGCGAEYTVKTGEPYFRGVEMIAWVDPQGQDIQKKFESYLRLCHIQATVTLNGNRWTEWTYKNKFERDLSFGKVYTNKSKTAGVFVRVNGTQMFSPYCSAPFNVVVEIDPTKSRQVLQANRDGLLYQYQAELESFVAELNVNKQSALREKRSKSTTYKGTGTFTRRRNKKLTPDKQVDAFERLLIDNNLILSEAQKKQLIEAPAIIRERAINTFLKENNIERPISTGAAPIHNSGSDITEEREELEFDLFTVVVHDDTRNPKVRKVIESYYPSKWDLLGQVGFRYDKRYGENRSFRAGVDKYKLLVMWKAACEFCIRMMQDELQHGPEEISWGVGWIFSEHAEAEFKPNDGVDFLLLNPVNMDGKMALSLSVKRDLIKILSLAAHEVTHIVYQDHDERFANLLNDILEEVMANLSDALNFMKDAKAEAEKKLNEKVAA